MRLLALDVGGTKLAAAFGEASARAATPPSGAAALEALLDLADEVGARDVDGIGVSFGGHVDGGIVRRSLHVPGWDDVALADVLRDRYGAPAAVENDANAGALGEWHDAGRPQSLCYVTVSTGVGAGIIVGGELLRGHDGLAGEVGHVVVEREGPVCACGRRGCVEAIASGRAIARDGDYGRAARALAMGISALISIVNPAVVSVGGGVASAGSPFWDPLLAEFERLRWRHVTTEVVRAADDAPLRGARVLAERAAAR